MRLAWRLHDRAATFFPRPAKSELVAQSLLNVAVAANCQPRMPDLEEAAQSLTSHPHDAGPHFYTT